MESYKLLNKQLIEKVQSLKEDVAYLSHERNQFRGQWLDSHTLRVEQKFGVCNTLANNFIDTIREIDCDLNPIQLIINASNRKGYSYAYELQHSPQNGYYKSSPNGRYVQNRYTDGRKSFGNVHTKNNSNSETVYNSPTNTGHNSPSNRRLTGNNAHNFSSWRLENICEESSEIENASMRQAENATAYNSASKMSNSSTKLSPSLKDQSDSPSLTETEYSPTKPLADLTNMQHSNSSNASVSTLKSFQHVEMRRGKYRYKSEEISLQPARNNSTANFSSSAEGNNNSDELLTSAMNYLHLNFEEVPSSTPRWKNERNGDLCNAEQSYQSPRKSVIEKKYDNSEWRSQTAETTYKHQSDSQQSMSASTRPRRNCKSSSYKEVPINCKMRNESEFKTRKCKRK